jgi:hypothetical protein
LFEDFLFLGHQKIKKPCLVVSARVSHQYLIETPYFVNKKFDVTSGVGK